MKAAIFAVVFIVLMFSASAVNPGLIGGLKLPIVNKVKNQYFATIMEGFKQISLPDMSMGDLKITGITVQVENNNADNVHIGFNEGKNGLDVSVDNTFIRVHVNWRYEVLFIKVSGTGDISGPINNLHMTMGFETQPKENFLIPKINIQDFDISFNEGGFDFKFDCGGCPSDVINLILNAFKGPLLDEVRNQARGVVNSQVVDQVNGQFMALYPTTLAVTSDISVCVATTGPLSVKTDYLRVPADFTIFLAKEGYNRQFDAPEFPSEDPANPGEVQLYASKYVYQSFDQSISKLPMRFDTTLYGFDVQIDVDGTKVPIVFETQNNNLHFSGGAIVTVPALSTVVEFKAHTDLAFSFRGGDSTNMVYIDPDVNTSSLKFDTLVVTVYGYRLDLSFSTGFVNYLIGLGLNHVVIPDIAVPKVAALPLTATAALVKFFDIYTEGG
eukprot:CAMPEP_0168318768 /NCGR_PEP_ID=MMETSP0213-20121227/668_1 /TAXON_ID=151035 /ORGANISM="Euplotes harpa, Strain FSP1.4" /LENGTH=441 /DNA_ID=CAMNT_0008319883 /DNA_START=33 /DNA_END=1354 /DNA_ORIENTATION=-